MNGMHRFIWCMEWFIWCMDCRLNVNVLSIEAIPFIMVYYQCAWFVRGGQPCSNGGRERDGHLQFWVKVCRQTGKILEEPSEVCYGSEKVGLIFPSWDLTAARHCYRDKDDGTACWCYVCPHHVEAYKDWERLRLHVHTCLASYRLVAPPHLMLIYWLCHHGTQTKGESLPRPCHSIKVNQLCLFWTIENSNHMIYHFSDIAGSKQLCNGNFLRPTCWQ